MSLKCNFSALKYCYNPDMTGKIGKTSFSVNKLGKFFYTYGKGRNNRFPVLEAAFDSVSAILNNERLRIFEDSNGKIIAGYAYKLRKNKLGDRSMYIDGLARDLENKSSKEIMTYVYDDIKKTAIKVKAKEITLFVYASDPRLKQNYSRLGFSEDKKCYVEKLYLMRVKTKDFLNNAYFKLRKLKELSGIKSVLQNK